MSNCNSVATLLGQLVRITKSMFPSDRRIRREPGTPCAERLLRIEKYLGLSALDDLNHALDLEDVHRLVGAVNERESKDKVRLALLSKLEDRSY